ncbi:hypothetical protein AVEN_103771-1 [Araneus ventricosus]|uniref:Uncharacterized protein n=1 Tax=Araneus ventricosus TaxID=182803 RepID=A0A4Y2HK25_ARAVE|nr:hypothetical protein AVEN_103771-1 [Araneus ventricosus]
MRGGRLRRSITVDVTSQFSAELSDVNMASKTDVPAKCELRSAILFLPAEARRKGVYGFSVETAGSGKHPFSPSSESLTDAWAPTVHKLCHDQAFCGLCFSFFAYRHFNSNFTFDDPKILSYKLIHSRNRGTVGHNVRLPRRGKSLMFTRSAS